MGTDESRQLKRTMILARAEFDSNQVPPFKGAEIDPPRSARCSRPSPLFQAGTCR